MSAFENFVQTELPLRPFVSIDPAQETIPVRRGPGPRQLDFVNLQDGQVLGKVAGVVQGISIGDVGQFLRSHIHTQVTPSLIWVITHNKNSVNCIVQIASSDSPPRDVSPDYIEWTDANTVTVHWTANQTGTAFLSFLD